LSFSGIVVHRPYTKDNSVFIQRRFIIGIKDARRLQAENNVPSRQQRQIAAG